MSVIVLSGQVSVTTAGTAVQFTTTAPGLYEIKPLGANTGDYIYIGNDGAGDVTSSNGYQLKKGLDSILVSVTNLDQLWLDAGDGDGACWHRVTGENISITPPTA